MVQTNSSINNDQPYSLKSLIEFFLNNFSLIFMLLLFLGAGLLTGSMWTENRMLKLHLASNVLGQAQAQPVAAAPEVPAGPSKEQLAKVPQVTSQDYIKGSTTAQVTLIVYTDYECPFCKKFHGTMEEIMTEYQGKVAWVYRHYPLSFHANAQLAAEAAECVGSYGGNNAFWNFTNAYLEKTDSSGTGVSKEEMLTLAANAGVSSTAVSGCLDRGDMADKVKAQMSAGSDAGVTGTPGTIIVSKNGDYDFIGGAVPIDQIKAKIDKYLD